MAAAENLIGKGSSLKIPYPLHELGGGTRKFTRHFLQEQARNQKLLNNEGLFFFKKKSRIS